MPCIKPSTRKFNASTVLHGTIIPVWVNGRAAPAILVDGVVSAQNIPKKSRRWKS